MTTTTAAMNTADETMLDIRVKDVSGQKQARLKINRLSREATAGELVKALIAKLGLVTTDGSGQAIQYRARVDDGRNLNAGELVGDAIPDGSTVTLVPKIHAG